MSERFIPRNRGIPETSGSRNRKPNNYGTVQGIGNLSLGKNVPCTHFISIPFKDEVFEKSFDAFREDLIKNQSRYNVNENIIQKTKKLHRTIINLYLPDQEAIDLAKKVLINEKNAVRKIMEKKSQYKHIVMRGLQDPKNYMRTTSLYANFTSQAICDITDHLRKAFRRAGIHIITGIPLANRIVVIQERLLTDENREKIDYSFNPGPVMSKYRDYNFGQFNIEEIHLSRRYKYDSSGYFEHEIVLHF
ncbi:uncharacterized protein LOC132260792 [Phlebotomus argentipes]|uniref:uncharacterized protein LOC132260792 n=1 Tax=Phlebotomus argentipes TaxID=94469 RepID=UPI002893157B|nr:uncharacterized protein LOC132260792 [Phlebotomus argentipes]